ncbi:hypothetical protein BDV97DRAFT_347552 [Delphinella strobiligena]|nr:hypothetical protein BDV97DRAFT_347552 [Delphinella strobiligena]
MPAYNGIVIRLESQYDIQRIQEYTLPSSHSGNDWRKSLRISAPPNTPNLADSSNARHLGSKSPVIDVHVPIYPNSQFWLIYHINPDILNHSPPPATASSSPIVDDMDVRYVYFKMLLPARSVSSFPLDNDKVHRTVSWGVGQKDGWKGKTMFGLFHGEHQGMARRTVDKRGFWFSADPDNEGFFDIQIFRARGRRRTSRVFPEMKARKREGNEVELVNTGRVKPYHPQRYYQYALLDPVDEPYVIFRYHLRSMDRLRVLGIDAPLLCNDMTPRFWRPSSDDPLQEEDGNLDDDQEESKSTRPNAEEDHVVQTPQDQYPEAKPCEFNRRETPELHLYQTEHHRPSQSITLHRHLSIPPTIRLLSTSSFHEPHSPAKSSTAKEPARPPFMRSSPSSGPDSPPHSDSDSDEYPDPDPDLDDHPHKTPSANANASATSNSNSTSTSNTYPAEQRTSTEIRTLRSSQITSHVAGIVSSTRKLKTPSPTDGVAGHQKRDVTPPSSARRKAMGWLLAGMRDVALRRKGEVEGEAEAETEKETEAEAEEVERIGGGYEIARDSW